MAFPLISSGVYGYPKVQALQVAVDTIRDFLADREMTVYMVLFDRDSTTIGQQLFTDLRSYIDDRYEDVYATSYAEHTRHLQALLEDMAQAAPSIDAPPCAAMSASLEEALDGLDESFSQMLLRKIDEKGMTDVQCYKKANISRKLFSKIRSNKLYRPSKATALAFAIALELPLQETRELLMKAGFALSRSSKADIIVEYFIEHGNYDIFAINEALFAFDQNLLGG